MHDSLALKIGILLNAIDVTLLAHDIPQSSVKHYKESSCLQK